MLKLPKKNSTQSYEPNTIGYPKLFYSFPEGENVLDMYVVRKRLRWYHLRKTSVLYAATTKGIYTIS